MTYRSRLVATLTAATLSLPAVTLAAMYKVDPDHTSVTFQVRHLFSRVQGRFDRFEGQIAFDPKNPAAVKVTGTIDVSSINTNVAERDKHLRAKDFFDVDAHPTITFVSTGASDVDAAAHTAKLAGNLTIHGVTKPVVLDVAYLGEGTDPWGNRRAGFSAKTTINRTDFGLSWNKALETGGVLVGEEITIAIEAEGLAE